MNAQSILPLGSNPEPISFDYFPSKQYALIWRNWGLVDLSRLAKILKTSEENILNLGESMGLPVPYQYDSIWQTRGYITIIRNNWHLLPYSQLLELLGWTEERMAFTLKEDDFLWHKFGNLKPAAKEIYYTDPTDKEIEEAQKIKEIIKNNFPDNETVQPPFEFLQSFNKVPDDFEKTTTSNNGKGLCMAHAYASCYGDPFLMNPDEVLPDGYLAKISKSGINALWLQAILYTLVDWKPAPQLSGRWQERQANLNKLAEKTAKYGIKLFIYINEPRALPESQIKLKELIGAKDQNENAACLCPSNEKTLEILHNSCRDLFKNVPALGGAFLITASENRTHCHSHIYPEPCEACSKIGRHEAIAKIISAIESGIHEANPDAEIIAWDWAWKKEWTEKAISLLPKRVKLMCTSETELETNVGGVKGEVLDYSISKPGPSPRAVHLWDKGKESGLDCVAKIQMNNTWECCTVPYIPAVYLVDEHLQNLRKIGINNFMVAWSLGGWCGGNLKLLHMSPEKMAENDFGSKAADDICSAWKFFSDAFAEFPLHHTAQLYCAPQNMGPANLLYKNPTGYSATMTCYPYDDLASWCGRHYPEEIFEEQFRKISEGWENGLKALDLAESKISNNHRINFDDLKSISNACYCHFRSVYLQTRFIRLRNIETPDNQKECHNIIEEEIKLAKMLYNIMLNDSRIGFEAANHYFYTPLSLQEKVINCYMLLSKYKD
jgi:hypothetical protein